MKHAAMLLLAALTAGAAERALPRVVLGIWDSADEKERINHLHLLAEMPLNHLGLVLEMVDVNKTLPAIDHRDDIRGIVSWLQDDRMRDPQAYARWVEAAVARGLKYVLIGDPGVSHDRAGKRMPVELMTSLFRAAGVEYRGDWSRITYDARIAAKTQLVDFEQSVGPMLPPFELVRAVHPSAAVHLRVRRAGPPVQQSDLIVTGGHGGWVAPGYIYYSDASANRRWRINPFEFFSQSLDAGSLPKPDGTTLNGRRIYYSHVDGDGWRSLVDIASYRKQGANTADVLIREIVEAYPDLPVTVAPVMADLDTAWHGTPRTVAQAKKVFSYPWVEAGSHTYSHPLDWEFFEHYSRDSEKEYGRDGKHEYDKARAYSDQPFDLIHEIGGAAEFLNKLLPRGKRVEVVQWPGDTNPFPEALRQTRLAGLRNINGGDSRLDGEFPSYSWVAPYGFLAGTERQIYSSNSNENTYTNLWTSRFFGFRYLDKTVTATESPIRVRPFNVYPGFPFWVSRTPTVYINASLPCRI
ncbi:MAG: hypothetical protein FJW40_21825 [Acidobacteria bacterium]|nr:hypothetical protein [Acidobacteriota bacterium]